MLQMPEQFICPKCGSSMPLGHSPVATGGNVLYWEPGLEEKSLLFSKQKKTIYFSGFGIRPRYCPAWYCRKCGFLLLDTQTLLVKE